MKCIACSLLAALLLPTGSYARTDGETSPDPAAQGEALAEPAERGGYEGTVSSSDNAEADDASGDVTAVLTEGDNSREELVGSVYGMYLPYENAKYYLRYRIDDNKEVSIIYYSENKDSTAENWGDIVIPDEIEGCPVTRIENSAFSKDYGGTFNGTLTLPKGLKCIEDRAFYNLSELSGELILPAGVTSIGRDAFCDCSGLGGGLILPEGLTNIGPRAFRNCSGLSGSLTFPGGLTELGESAFEGCSGFEGDIRLPEGLTNIGSRAFWKCSGFNGTLTLPGSLISIGFNAFDGCSGLTGDLVLPPGLTVLKEGAFMGCGGFDGSLILPGSLGTIERNVFRGCYNLLNVSIPASVTCIREAAFETCNGLTHVYYEGGNWGAVAKEAGNAYLENANIHCNSYYSAENMPPAFGGNENPVAVITPTGSSTPLFTDRYEPQAYRTYGDTVNSYLYDNGSGITRVEYYDGKVLIENYDSNFRYQAGWTLEPELPIWGGFYAGEKYNFLIFGQENPNEDDSREVIRVVKYDKAWNRLGHASLKGANTTVPFGHGSLRCDEYGGMLYVRTCHRMYTSSDGLNHQANLTLSVREIDMRITDGFYGVDNVGSGYVSHSFNQFLLTDADGNIVALDHGDAYPRAAVMIRYGEKAGRNNYTDKRASAVNLFVFPGETGDNDTKASIGGLAETGSGYIAAYNYSPNDNDAGIRNIHISYMPKDSFAKENVRTWTDPAATGTTPVIASAGAEGGYVLWRNPNETDGVRYVRYDAQGNISQMLTCGNVLLSDCQPILYRGNLVWYATDEKGLKFYALNEGGISTYDSANPNHHVPQDPKQVRSFVSRMYTVALGRDAEPQGLNDWTNRLLSYEVDGSGIANGFIMSDEFKNKNVSDEIYVDTLYRTFFDREADAGGRATWLEALANGNSRGHVLAGFVNSVEFDNLCGRFGIIRGTMESNEKAIGPGVRQFVNRCYIKVLGREGEPAGVSDWTGRIARGEETPESTAKLFFFSEEYANKNTSNEDFVETLYQTFMDRASDPAGKSDWLGRLAAGTSREEVLEGFSRSEEFANILKSFGL